MTLRFAAPDRAAWVLTEERPSTDAEARVRGHLLERYEPRRGGPRIALVACALLGLLVAGVGAVALLPTRGAPDGLTPTRGELWWCALLAGGPAGAALGAAVGWRIARALRRTARLRTRPSTRIRIGKQVRADDSDCGPLESVESHPASAVIFLVTERCRVRIELDRAEEASALAAALSRVAASSVPRSAGDGGVAQ